MLSNFAFKFNLRRCNWEQFVMTFIVANAVQLCLMRQGGAA